MSEYIAPPTTPIGNTYRGIFSDWFNAKNIAKEDWQREMQSLAYANEFNANEAQKQRDFEERMSNTAYTRVVQDMKSAGLNPVLAYSQGGASTPSGSAATASGSTSQSQAGKGSTAEFLNMLGSIASIFAGIYTAGAGNATKLASAKLSNEAKLASAKISAGARTASSVSATYNSKGVLTGYTKKKFH